MGCIFCELSDVVIKNDFAVALYDKYPVTEGHLLIIPRRHVNDYFELNLKEKIAIDQLIIQGRELLDKNFSPDGYNIGNNCGTAAGQTIFHCHIHLIPRYSGDIKDPRGGVRGVIPNKRIY